jgi:uncharacterized protein with HEPN domain
MRDDREKLQDMLDAIARIEEHAHRGREAFDSDEMLQVWMIHHIELIGEAAAQLSETFRTSHPEVPWREIIAMRNLLVHAYFKTSPSEVWRVVERDIPKLKAQVEALVGRCA